MLTASKASQFMLTFPPFLRFDTLNVGTDDEALSMRMASKVHLLQ